MSRHGLGLVPVAAFAVLAMVMAGCQWPSSRYLSVIPQCWEIGTSLEQQWEEIQRSEITRDCYDEDGFRVNMGLRSFETESQVNAYLEVMSVLADQPYAPASSVWTPGDRMYTVTNYSTVSWEDIGDRLATTCTGSISHSVQAKSGRIVVTVTGTGGAVWRSPCLARDLIDANLQPELINGVMDMIVLRLEHTGR